jgi:cysteine-rich repeat protein
MVAVQVWLVVVLACVGCVQSGAVPCGDITCPPNTQCDAIHVKCVTDAQTTVCANLSEGDPCVAGTFNGICDRGICAPGCGDGAVNDAEQCDDGDFENHDGCSSVCEIETAGWRRWANPWSGRLSHAATYDPTANMLLVVGGSDATTTRSDGWTRMSDGWKQLSLPGPRWLSMLAYDATRNVTVLFGGFDPNNTVFGDTWELDVKTRTWTKVSPVMSPPGRGAAAMVYDDTRKTIVLFGGTNFGTVFDDTWEYDGITWTNISGGSTLTPPARTYHAMAFDAATGRTVLTGGRLANGTNACGTWQLASGEWTSITSPAQLCMTAPALAYVPSIQRIVLFGGVTGAGYTSKTWELNGTTWSQPALLVEPPARGFHTLTPVSSGELALVGGTDGAGALYDDIWYYGDSQGARYWSRRPPPFSPGVRIAPLAYDPSRKEIVLFDGFTGSDETWSFDRQWTQRKGSVSPQGRAFHLTTWSSARQSVVVFGGEAEFGAGKLADTWFWNGTQWTAGPMGPPARSQGALVEDRERGVLILYGGYNALGPLADTWELEGSTWTLMSSASPPGPQAQPALGFDARTKRVIMQSEQGTTWVYANRTWTELTATGPPPRSAASMVYNPRRDRLLLWGGLQGAAFLKDAWELDGDQWRQVVISGESPPDRTAGQAAFHERDGSMVMHGGSSHLGYREDTWLFQYRSNTPDEICDNAIDDDGDRQVDGIDPDCRY